MASSPVTMYTKQTAVSFFLFMTSLSFVELTDFCLPGQPCWPGVTEVVVFHRSLQGRLLQPFDGSYADEGRARLLSFTATPAFIVMVNTISDVRLSLRFARKFCIRVSVYASGHDYNGRSTASGSLQINLSQLTNVTVDIRDSLSDTGASVTAQAGASWIQVYSEVDRHKKQVVGANAGTVSVSGYAMGGGHGPLSRSYGLASDNILEFHMMLYNGTIARCSATGTSYYDENGATKHSSNIDLFWAVRGGGGASFGIALSFKFRIYAAPSGLVEYGAVYPLNVRGDSSIGERLLRLLFKLVADLPPVWSGYISTKSVDDPSNITTAVLSISLLQNAPWSSNSTRAIAPLVNFEPSYRGYASFTNHSSFLRYIERVKDSGKIWLYVANAFINSKSASDNHVTFFSRTSVQPRIAKTTTGCIWTLLGGEVSTSRESAVSDSFRRNDISATCWIAWADTALDNQTRGDNAMTDRLLASLGDGSYLNEAAYDAENWARRFWGHNYARLQRVKASYDPHHVFDCHHCVSVKAGGKQYSGVVEFIVLTVLLSL